MDATDWSWVRHFTPDEFGPGVELLDPVLVYSLDDLRKTAGVPIFVHEAYALTGHADQSFHGKGMAVDFHFGEGLTPLEQFAAVTSVRAFGGIGWYPYWRKRGWHADIRPGALRVMWWRGRDGVYRYGWREVAKAIMAEAAR